jgi:adenylate cyclase
MSAMPESFAGTGTVMLTDIRSLSSTARLEPQAVVDFVSRHQRLLCGIIEAHQGIVHQFVGDAILAYWHPRHTDPNHAQLAFDAGRAILDAMPAHLAATELRYDVTIVLGTGELRGAEFGPIRQFQIIGKGMAVAERLSRFNAPGGSSIRMSQYTTALIRPAHTFDEAGTIARESLEDLRVFLYHRTS